MPQFHEINEEVKLLLDFGTGDHRMVFNINEIYSDLGESICLGLLFFHSLTGCDSTSAFVAKTKNAFYHHWLRYDREEELNWAFQQLSWLPSMSTLLSVMEVIERFVCSLYGESTPNIDEARFNLFSHSADDNLRRLPPTKNALKMHVQRAAFQAGWVWGNSLTQDNLFVYLIGYG